MAELLSPPPRRMMMNELTLGDLIGTGQNAVMDVMLGNLLGKVVKPEPILVESESDGLFHWGKPVTADDGRMVLASKVA